MQNLSKTSISCSSMVFPLILVTVVVLAAVDCAVLGINSKVPSPITGNGYCPPEYQKCDYSYMSNYRGLQRHTYIPKHWNKCTEHEACAKNTWKSHFGYTQYCGKWEKCKEHQGLQSPVNLNFRQAKYRSFNPRYVNGRDVPGKFTNNGHSPTFTVTGKGVDEFRVAFRGVPCRKDTDYIFYSLNFHIGKKSSKAIGSEHSMNNQYHDGEIYLVHWKRDYATQSPELATKAKDGLVTIAVFFDIDDSSNSNTYVDNLIQNYVKNTRELYRCSICNGFL